MYWLVGGKHYGKKLSSIGRQKGQPDGERKVRSGYEGPHWIVTFKQSPKEDEWMTHAHI